MDSTTEGSRKVTVVLNASGTEFQLLMALSQRINEARNFGWRQLSGTQPASINVPWKLTPSSGFAQILVKALQRVLAAEISATCTHHSSSHAIFFWSLLFGEPSAKAGAHAPRDAAHLAPFNVENLADTRNHQGSMMLQAEFILI